MADDTVENVADTETPVAFNLRNPEVERLAETVARLADELDEIALAVTRGEPLLCRGDDVTATDLELALPTD